MGLYQNILQKRVGELNLRKAILVNPDTMVCEAVDRMRDEKLGCVVVVDSAGKPTGMFTEGVLIQMLSRGVDPLLEKVGAHVAPVWACVKKTDTIATALHEMESQRLRFLCVTEDDGRAVALTGQKGLMEFIAEHFPHQVQLPVRRVGAPSYDRRREGA